MNYVQMATAFNAETAAFSAFLYSIAGGLFLIGLIAGILLYGFGGALDEGIKQTGKKIIIGIFVASVLLAVVAANGSSWFSF